MSLNRQGGRVGITLRDYQKTSVDGVRGALRKHKRVLLQSSTGSGKTAMAAYMAQQAVGKNKTVYFICHRRELVDQTAGTFEKVGLDFSFVAAGYEYDPEKSVQICSVDTLKNRLDKIPEPDLCIWDECVAGNSMIDTDVGVIPIKDVEKRNAKHVLSYNGYTTTFAPISGFRKTGFKKVFLVSWRGHDIRCTQDHLFYTDKGWVEACSLKRGSKILVLAAAVESSQMTAGEDQGSLSPGISFQEQEAGMSGQKNTRNTSATYLFANAGAKEELSHHLRRLISSSLREEQRTILLILSVIKGIKRDLSSLLVETKGELFLAPFSETLAFCLHTLDQRTQDLLSITQQNSLSGLSTKRDILKQLACVSNTQETLGMETCGLEGVHRALISCLMFIESHIKEEQKKLQKNGFMRSAISASHGGIAMMAHISQQEILSLSTQRDLVMVRLKSFLDSLGKDLGLLSGISTQKERLSKSRWDRLKSSSSRLKSTFQISSDISWESVREVKECCAEDVYDISVEGAQCFFANGVLVHNCHHLGAAGWAKVQDRWKCFHVGLSATPRRGDGKGLNDRFDHLVPGPMTSWLIEQGFLANYRLFSIPGVDLKGVHTKMGDYDKSEAEAAMRKPSVTGDIVKHWKEIASDRLTIGFALSVKHSEYLCARFKANGILAVHLDAKTPKEERRETLMSFARGEIKVVFQVRLFDEGYDLAANSGMDVAIGCVIDAAPTQSLGTWLQRCGRALRPQEKPAIILDHAVNFGRHGAPCEDRVWTLEGREVDSKFGPQEADIGFKQCGKCFYCHPPSPTCPSCGYVYQTQGRTIEERAGELIEMEKMQIKQDEQNETKKARTLNDLIALAKKRKYKNPVKWAQYKLNGRKQAHARYRR